MNIAMLSPSALSSLTSSLLPALALAITVSADMPFERSTFFATAYPFLLMITDCLLGASIAELSSADASASTFW